MQIHRANLRPASLPAAQDATSQVAGPSVQETTQHGAGRASAQKVSPAHGETAQSVDQVSQKVLSKTSELTSQLPRGMQGEMSHLGRNHPDRARALLSLSNQALQAMDSSPATERLRGLQAGLLQGLGQHPGQLDGVANEGFASAAPSFGLGDVAQEELPEEEAHTRPSPVGNEGIYGAQGDTPPQVGPLGPSGPPPGDPLAPTDIVRLMASQVIDVKNQVPSLWNEIKGLSQAMQGL